MDLIYEKPTEKTFEEALESVKKELKERKFGVLWELNFKDKLEEHDIEFKNNFKVLEVCNPKKAGEVLNAHIDVGYFLPCKMVVYEKEGQVMVGTLKPEKLIGMMNYEDLGTAAKEVQNTLIEAVDAAV
ncbi:MAG: DUF302 domain-containing protein [Gallicola sp.]|nr:DUF302 domain-containing protein [Gallicola sp.]